MCTCASGTSDGMKMNWKDKTHRLELPVTIGRCYHIANERRDVDQRSRRLLDGDKAYFSNFQAAEQISGNVCGPSA